MARFPTLQEDLLSENEPLSQGAWSELRGHPPLPARSASAVPPGGWNRALTRLQQLPHPSPAAIPTILALQNALGNRATRAALSPRQSPGSDGVLTGAPASAPSPGPIQAKPLTVGPAHDPYEREADRIAEQLQEAPASRPSISRLSPRPTPYAQPSSAGGLSPDVHSPSVAGPGAFEPGPAFEQQLATTQGHGTPLDSQTRQLMTAHLGHDFGPVRIHTDPTAHALNTQLQSRAFTHGTHIYMGQGQYAPDRPEGKKLLAHELTHVVQQNALTGPASDIQPSRLIQRTTDTAEPTSTVAAPTQNKKQAQDFLMKFRKKFIELSNSMTKTTKSVAGVQATLQTLQADAAALTDPRFAQLITQTETDLTALFNTPSPALEDLVTGEELETVRLYSKREKYQEQRSEHAMKRNALEEEARGSKPWQKWGTKIQKSWESHQANKYQDKALRYHNRFMARPVEKTHVVVMYVKRAARAAHHDHATASGLYNTLSEQYAGPKEGVHALFESVIQEHAAAALVQYYEEISEQDWWQVRTVTHE